MAISKSILLSNLTTQLGIAITLTLQLYGLVFLWKICEILPLPSKQETRFRQPSSSERVMTYSQACTVKPKSSQVNGLAHCIVFIWKIFIPLEWNLTYDRVGSHLSGLAHLSYERNYVFFIRLSMQVRSHLSGPANLGGLAHLI